VNEQRRKSQGAAATAPGARAEPDTVRPPFDPEEFARNADSSIRLTGSGPPAPLPPTMPPPAGLPSYPVDLAPTSSSRRVALHGDTILSLTVASGDLDWFDLSPRAIELLLQVNGRDSVATICARCELQLKDAIDVLDELAREGLIASSGTRE
jgi:hypothetical protein